MDAVDVNQLQADLDGQADKPFDKVAKYLVKQGYRMPGCSERWQVDRLSGALAGAALSSGYDTTAQVLVEVVGITKITSHRK